MGGQNYSRRIRPAIIYEFCKTVESLPDGTHGVDLWESWALPAHVSPRACMLCTPVLWHPPETKSSIVAPGVHLLSMWLTSSAITFE